MMGARIQMVFRVFLGSMDSVVQSRGVLSQLEQLLVHLVLSCEFEKWPSTRFQLIATVTCPMLSFASHGSQPFPLKRFLQQSLSYTSESTTSEYMPTTTTKRRTATHVYLHRFRDPDGSKAPVCYPYLMKLHSKIKQSDVQQPLSCRSASKYVLLCYVP